MIKLSFLFALWASLAAAAPAPAAPQFQFDAGNGKVSFLAQGHPSAIKIRGEGAGATGTLRKDAKGLSGVLEFKLDSLATGISMRDEHMKKKYLRTEKFPVAKLELADLVLPVGNGAVPFTGKLTLDGVEKPVSGTAQVDQTNANALGVNAEFTLKLSEFGIEIPKYAGITVAEDVKVSAELKGASK